MSFPASSLAMRTQSGGGTVNVNEGVAFPTDEWQHCALSLGHFKRAGGMGCSSLSLTSGGIIDFVKASAEIDCVQLCAKTRCPAKLYIGAHTLGFISRIREVCSFGRNTKAPDRTFPGAVRLSVVDFIDSPVVSCSRNKAIRKRKSGKANNNKRPSLLL